MRASRLALTAVAAAVMAFSATTPAAAAEPLPVPYQFLPSAIAAGAQVNAPGTNDWACRPSPEHPRPVVLVHGTGGNKSTNWATYGPLLKNEGYCVFALTYGAPVSSPTGHDALGGLGDMRASAAQLAKFVDEVRTATGSDQVDLVGHSQGTLMPAHYVKFLGGASAVHHYISIAPAWNGTGTDPVRPLSALANAFGLQVPVCGACPQMLAGSQFLADLHEGGLASPGVDYLNIMTRYDELVVPHTSGAAPGMTNTVIQDLCPQDFSDHLQLAADPNAARLVLNRLDPANAQRVECRPQLPAVGGA
ncbi:esterase/lipase family protein [Saccharopolyspora tripterygii]